MRIGGRLERTWRGGRRGTGKGTTQPLLLQFQLLLLRLQVLLERLQIGSHRVNALPVVYKRLSLGLELLLLLLEEALPLGHASCLKLDLCLALS